MDKLVEPFAPALLLVSTAASIIIGWLFLEKVHRSKVKALIDESYKGKTFTETVTAIVTASFTGRAEADALWRNDHLRKTEEAIKNSLLDHERREREYVDTLRDKISEYHAQSLAMLKETKNIAFHVSHEYNEIKKEIEAINLRLRQLEAKVENIP